MISYEIQSELDSEPIILTENIQMLSKYRNKWKTKNNKLRWK